MPTGQKSAEPDLSSYPSQDPFPLGKTLVLTGQGHGPLCTPWSTDSQR